MIEHLIVDKLIPNQLYSANNFSSPFIFGYECEFAPTIYYYYVDKYLLTRGIVNRLNGHWDGSGPYEVNTPPVAVSDVELVKRLNTVLLILKVSYDSAVEEYEDTKLKIFYDLDISIRKIRDVLNGEKVSYREYTYRGNENVGYYLKPCGRHIHINVISNCGTVVDEEGNKLSFDKVYFRIVRYLLYLTPLMAMYYNYDEGYIAYRERASYYAIELYNKPPIPRERRYGVVTWNGHGTLEIRLNEAPLPQAWAVACIVYAIAIAKARTTISRYRLTYDEIKNIIENGIRLDRTVRTMNKVKPKFVEGYSEIVKFGIEVLERTELVPKRAIKMIESIVKKEVEEPKAITWISHAYKYREFIDEDVLKTILEPELDNILETF